MVGGHWFRFRGLIAALSVTLFTGCRPVSTDADEVLKKLTAHWRWSMHWLGTTGFEKEYAEGKRIRLTVFWAIRQWRAKMGFCSPQLGVCVAYTNPEYSTERKIMRIDQATGGQAAFERFVRTGFTGNDSFDAGTGPNSMEDYRCQEVSISLPNLEWPKAEDQSSRDLIAEEAREIRASLRCTPIGKPAPNDCSGELLFPIHGQSDPMWFVLRRCSTRCGLRMGDSIFALRRGDRGWDVTVGGFIDQPKEEVERLRRQIERVVAVREPI